MTDIAIQAEGLSKEYRVAAIRDQKLTMQERMGRALMAPIKRIGGLLSGNATAALDLDESFWALKDVSFTINEGEVVGIIGQNGAGKSTLMKVLSKVTEPTAGRAVVNGRLGSLLEVGTGFHPQLSGRENVFLNGSILGMRKEEVTRKFDEIVEFSEVGRFIDTPVKHYSTGMRVRLAFAVAAHLEPEVLFIDEVLAVGDIGFQKKCNEKIQAVAKSGCTVLVVSHNASAITAMCHRAIWLEKGQVVADGPAARIMADYLNNGVQLTGERVWPDGEAGNEIVCVNAMRMLNEKGDVVNNIDVREPLCIEADIEVHQPGYGIVLRHDVIRSDGMPAFSSLDVNNPVWEKKAWQPGKYTTRMWIPANFLQVDTYTVDTGLFVWEPISKLIWAGRNALNVQIMDGLNGPTSRMGFHDSFHGPIRPLLKWETEANDRVLADASVR